MKWSIEFEQNTNKSCLRVSKKRFWKDEKPKSQRNSFQKRKEKKAKPDLNLIQNLNCSRRSSWPTKTCGVQTCRLRQTRPHKQCLCKWMHYAINYFVFYPLNLDQSAVIFTLSCFYLIKKSFNNTQRESILGAGAGRSEWGQQGRPPPGSWLDPMHIGSRIVWPYCYN